MSANLRYDQPKTFAEDSGRFQEPKVIDPMGVIMCDT